MAHFPEFGAKDTSKMPENSYILSCTETNLCANYLFERREPMFVFVFDEALFAFAYATPPFVFELL